MQMKELGEKSLPSQVTTGDGWHFAYRQKDDYPCEAKGKWIVYARRDKIDNLWQLLRLATEEGYLGSFSKVSTAVLSETAKTGVHTICIYSYDAEDRDDIMRIREFLRDMNIMTPLEYQTWNAEKMVTIYKE